MSSSANILMAAKRHGGEHRGVTTVDLVREDGRLVDAKCTECPWTYSGDLGLPV